MKTENRLISFALCFVCSFSIFAQNKPISQEMDADGIPVLFKHLPDSETAQKTAILAKTLPELKQAVGSRPILDVITFEGGTEAAIANYGESKVAIVEFNSPQQAIDADSKILAKLVETGAESQTVYRKVGNYAVFAFDSPDETTAMKLIDQVKYEKKIQWLGENPFLYKAQQTYLVDTFGNVILTVIEATVFGFFAALGIGGLAGYFVFQRRRKSNAWNNYFTDAGGMTRLNLDELSAPDDSEGLLKGFLKD